MVNKMLSSAMGVDDNGMRPKIERAKENDHFYGKTKSCDIKQKRKHPILAKTLLLHAEGVFVHWN